MKLFGETDPNLPKEPILVLFLYTVAALCVIWTGFALVSGVELAGLGFLAGLQLAVTGFVIRMLSDMRFYLEKISKK